MRIRRPNVKTRVDTARGVATLYGRPSMPSLPPTHPAVPERAARGGVAEPPGPRACRTVPPMPLSAALAA